MDTNNSDRVSNDNDLSLPPTDSFWEVGKYNRVVKRCDDGNRLTSDLVSMISERAELEKVFSKMLKSWSKKWSDYVAKSPEYGTMESAWKAVMAEADATAEIHQGVHDELQNGIIPSVKSWQKGKYVKSMMHIKSTKDFDEDFRRAQKPWAKLYDKVDKYKREYHTATKNLKLAEGQENSAKQDASVTQEQRSKLFEKVDRARKEKDTYRTKYAEALQELNRANPKYMDDMNEVFARCQQFERERLVKFREFLGSTEKCLDISVRLQAPIFQQFSQTIKNSDPDRDLTWWSDTYGATMKMNWPIFEEPKNLIYHQPRYQYDRISYSGDLSCNNYDTYNRRPLARFVNQTSAGVLVVDSYATLRRSMRRTAAVVTRVRRDLSKREEYSEVPRTITRRGKNDNERENQVVVTAIRTNNNVQNTASYIENRQPTNSINQSPVPPARSAHPSVYPVINTNTTVNSNPFGDDDDRQDSISVETAANNRSTYGGTTNNGDYSSLPTYATSNMQTSYPAAANPFLDDDEDTTDSTSPTSRGSSSLANNPGVLVRALYDYEAQEADELSFKQGEIFTKLEDEDDQGWCKGRVGDRTGLYPATYVSAL